MARYDVEIKLPVILNNFPDGEGWIAECPILPGCFSQGATVEEALEAIKEAMNIWVETATNNLQAVDAMKTPI